MAPPNSPSSPSGHEKKKKPQNKQNGRPQSTVPFIFLSLSVLLSIASRVELKEKNRKIDGNYSGNKNTSSEARMTRSLFPKPFRSTVGSCHFRLIAVAAQMSGSIHARVSSDISRRLSIWMRCKRMVSQATKKQQRCSQQKPSRARRTGTTSNCFP